MDLHRLISGVGDLAVVVEIPQIDLLCVLSVVHVTIEGGTHRAHILEVCGSPLNLSFVESYSARDIAPSIGVRVWTILVIHYILIPAILRHKFLCHVAVKYANIVSIPSLLPFS